LISTEPQKETGQTGIRRWQVAAGALVLIVLAAAVSVTAFCTVCTDFSPYDDMGYFMLTQKTFAAGHALYDQTFTQYGPAYYAWEQFLHAVTRQPLSHDSTLLYTTFAVVAGALLCAGYVARLGRSLFLTSLTLLAVSTLLLVMKLEPGHPQELCVLLLTGMLAGSSMLDSARRPAVLLGLMGLCVGALSMTKPNLGVFAAVAVALSLSRLAPDGRARKFLFGLSALAALALPITLMRHNLPEVTGYCVVQTAATLLLVLQLASWEPNRRLSWGAFASALAGFAVVLVASAAYALATGTMVAGLARGLVLQHVAFDRLFSFYSPFGSRDVFLPVAVSVGAWVVSGPGRRLCRGWPWLPDALKVALVPFMVFAVTKLGITMAFLWCLPLAAATAAPSPRAKSTTDMAPRYLALSLAVLNGLWGYPVWGSQAGLSFFLLIPVVLVSCADALRYGCWSVSDQNAPAPSPKPRLVWKALSLVAALVVLVLGCLQAGQAAGAYTRLQPSGLRGSHLLHLPSEQAAFYRQIIQSARAHGRTLFTMPGLGSLYFWAEAEPPTCINPTAWMTLLTPEQQGRVVSDLQRAPDLCVVRWNPLVDFWTRGRDISTNQVVRYIEDNFTVAESLNGCDFMARGK
jgi:hypothetical protein